jgi:hypothetical protein
MIVFVLAGASMFVLAGSSLAAKALALKNATKQSNAAEPLRISIDRSYDVTKTGDEFDFNTLVKNSDPHGESGPLVVAMNIINLGSGQPVDPEDWSPVRTQTVGSLEPGQTSDLTWTIESILKGDYLIYLVVTPKPAGSTSTSRPVASSGIHLTVKPHTRLNPGGIMPLHAARNRHADRLDRGVVGLESTAPKGSRMVSRRLRARCTDAASSTPSAACTEAEPLCKPSAFQPVSVLASIELTC